jgi:hypothetical protein
MKFDARRMGVEVRGPNLGAVLASQARPSFLGRAARTHGVGGWIRPPEKEAFELGSGSQLRLDRVEVGAELIAHALDGRNDRNRDAGGNQSVFDGGSARLISEKFLESDFQTCLLLRWVCPTGAISSCYNLRFPYGAI